MKITLELFTGVLQVSFQLTRYAKIISFSSRLDYSFVIQSVMYLVLLLLSDVKKLLLLCV